MDTIARLKALKRYEVGDFDEGSGYTCPYEEENPDGDWIRAEDVQAIIKELLQKTEKSHAENRS